MKYTEITLLQQLHVRPTDAPRPWCSKPFPTSRKTPLGASAKILHHHPPHQNSKHNLLLFRIRYHSQESLQKSAIEN